MHVSPNSHRPSAASINEARACVVHAASALAIAKVCGRGQSRDPQDRLRLSRALRAAYPFSTRLKVSIPISNRHSSNFPPTNRAMH
jgi:hypothetical protein